MERHVYTRSVVSLSVSVFIKFRDLALHKYNSAYSSRTKRTSSSCHWKLTCSRHDIAENLLTLNNNHQLIIDIVMGRLVGVRGQILQRYLWIRWLKYRKLCRTKRQTCFRTAISSSWDISSGYSKLAEVFDSFSFWSSMIFVSSGFYIDSVESQK